MSSIRTRVAGFEGKKLFFEHSEKLLFSSHCQTKFQTCFHRPAPRGPDMRHTVIPSHRWERVGNQVYARIAQKPESD